MKVIITGTTGYVGEGVLRYCLEDSRISEVLSVSRRTTGIQHPKLHEYLVPDFLALQPGDTRLQGYDAVFFCLGISSVGVPMEKYKITCYDIPLHIANCLTIKEKTTFIYVSGAGTSPNNPQQWAKVKSKTEQDLLALPFKGFYGFRPGFMKPHPQQRARKGFQIATKILYPLMRLLRMANTMAQVERAMVNVALKPYKTPFIGVRDIDVLSDGTA